MEKYIIKAIILMFPVFLSSMGFVLVKNKGLIKKLGIYWMILGVLSMIVTLYFSFHWNRPDYLFGIVFIQVLMFLLGTILFQIIWLRKQK